MNQYPHIAESDGLVVLFTAPASGKVIKTDGTYEKGHESSDWNEKVFKPVPHHALKIYPEYFIPLMEKKKTAEIRYHDRDYQVGDILMLREWSNVYTGRYEVREITHIHTGLGLPENYVMISMK